MSNSRLLRCTLYSVLLLALPAGCELLQPSRPVGILVQDAETKKPIAGAVVELSCPGQGHAGGAPSAGRSGVDGIVRLWASPAAEAGFLLEGTAPGYLTELQDLRIDTVRAIRPASPFEAVERRPASVVLECYAAPRPTIELVVPAAYRGVVKVAVLGQEGGPYPAGQRSFRYVVPPSGVLQVTGPPLLQHVVAIDFSLQYADGVPLSRNARDTAFGFWWLKSEGGSEHFQVGPKSEYDAFRASLQPEGGGRSAGGGQGEGRGRRNRRGSSSSADTSPAGMGP